jgi:integrase
MVFKPLLKESGIDSLRFYDLRHTSATLALSNGDNVKVVSEGGDIDAGHVMIDRVGPERAGHAGHVIPTPAILR